MPFKSLICVICCLNKASRALIFPSTNSSSNKAGAKLIAQVLIGTHLCLASINAFALPQSNAPETKENSRSEENIETIEVEGQAGDAALQAFQAGNYQLAEIKFKDNVRCALRAENRLKDVVLDAQNAQLSQSINNPQPNGRDANVRVAAPSLNVQSSSQQGAPLRELTCENRGYQVYMVGMSQLQLGRTDEAEENFESAIRLNKHLHDAMYRLALMKLLRQDKDGATKHFKAMQSLLKRCNNKCDAQQALQERLAFLEKALAGEVRL